VLHRKCQAKDQVSSPISARVGEVFNYLSFILSSFMLSFVTNQILISLSQISSRRITTPIRDSPSPPPPIPVSCVHVFLSSPFFHFTFRSLCFSILSFAHNYFVPKFFTDDFNHVVHLHLKETENLVVLGFV